MSVIVNILLHLRRKFVSLLGRLTSDLFGHGKNFSVLIFLKVEWNECEFCLSTSFKL